MLLLVGYALIRRRNVVWHRRMMLSATVLAALFLVVYVTRLALVGSKLFPGEGLLRLVYFGVLVPHVILAIAIMPMVVVTLRRAFSGQFTRHRAIARVTFPVWLFVAVSGWAVYAMLYLL